MASLPGREDNQASLPGREDSQASLPGREDIQAGVHCVRTHARSSLKMSEDLKKADML